MVSAFQQLIPPERIREGEGSGKAALCLIMKEQQDTSHSVPMKTLGYLPTQELKSLSLGRPLRNAHQNTHPDR